MKVAHATGEHDANIGDRVTFYDGSTWEVVRLKGGGMYSPSGLGGTPVFACKPIGEIPAHYKQYLEEDGTVNMCGDSLAGALAESPQSQIDKHPDT